MGFLEYFVIGILLVICSLLVFLVVLQNSKGGGLASNIQASNVASQIIGVRRAADIAERLTWWFMGSIFLLTIIINLIISSNLTSTGGGNELKMKGAVEKQKTEAAPQQGPPNQQQQGPAPTK